jgi:DedD protein
MEEFPSRAEYRLDPELRQRLIKRVAMAAVAIAALLGGLALIDQYSMAPPTAHPTPPVTKPTPSKPPEAAPTPPAPQVEPTVATPVTSEQTSAPVLVTVPGAAAKAVGKPTTGAPSGVTLPGKVAVSENDRPTAKPAAVHADAAVTEAGPKQFVFQMGIFNDVANAQRLDEKLKAGGVPSRIEARVQVGPFKTREEAEAARKKLSQLGISPGILIPVKK